MSPLWKRGTPCCLTKTVNGGLVDVDSADQLCEERLHLHRTQIQCTTVSDMEKRQDLDVIVDGKQHGKHQRKPVRAVLVVPVPCFPLVPVYMMPTGHAVIGGASHVTRQLCTFDRE
ncbi:hypothetical protein Q8A73_000732 [Channa argus]|nr:hypothetical protein Q8A73_000732 [Channa argus]